MDSACQQITTSYSLTTDDEETSTDVLNSTTNSNTELRPPGKSRNHESSYRCELNEPPGKVQYYDFLHRHRKIDWRWQRAKEVVESGKSLDPLRDDADVERLEQYLTLGKSNSQAAAQWHPDLAQAQRIRENGGRQEALLRAWLITELSLREVAERVDIAHKVVAAYAMMFFDLGDRLSCRNWVISHVINLHTREFKDFEEKEFATWEFEALDGAQALEDLLALVNPEPYRGNQLARRIDEEMARRWRYQFLVLFVTTPWGSGNAAAWLRLYFESRRQELRQHQRQHLFSVQWWDENLPLLGKCSTSRS